MPDGNGELSVLFADLAGFTALTEAHGDGDAADVADRFTAVASAALAPGARVVKTIGDAVMIVAPDARAGLETALGVLRAVDAESTFPGVRIGLHVGPVVELFSLEDEARFPRTQVMDPVCRMFVDGDDAPARLPWGDRLWLFCSFECARAFSDDPERYITPAGGGA